MQHLNFHAKILICKAQKYLFSRQNTIFKILVNKLKKGKIRNFVFATMIFLKIVEFSHQKNVFMVENSQI